MAIRSRRSHCFNYSSDFNCIFIVSYIYYIARELSENRLIEKLLLLPLILSSGKNKRWNEKKKLKEEENRRRKKGINHDMNQKQNRSALDYDF